METLRDFATLAWIEMVAGVWFVGAITIFKWLMSKRNASGSTRYPTCGHSAETVTESSTNGESQ